MPASPTPLSTGPAPMLRPRAPATLQQGMTRADFERKLSETTLVLVELGAAWPRSLVESSPYAACRVLVEQEGEGPLAFAARVQTFAGSLFPSSVALETAVLACSERADETAMAGRRNVAELCRMPRATESSTLALPGGSSLSRVA